MSDRLLCVTWPQSLESVPCESTLRRVIREALRLSVWRVGCVALLCRVEAHQVCLIVRCRTTHAPEQLIEWVRAAARFAVTAYAGWSPPWDTPYTYRWMASADLHHELSAIMHPIPVTPDCDQVADCESNVNMRMSEHL
jgi:hypothetical protein